jgi:hypothetical protein
LNSLISAVADGFHLLLEAEERVDTSKGDVLRLDEVEDLDGMSSGVEDDDGTEAEVAATDGCVPLWTYEPLACNDDDDDDDDIRTFIST